MDMKGGAISYDDYFNGPSGLNVRPSLGINGPPPDEGAHDGDTICTQDNSWVRVPGKWVPLLNECVKGSEATYEQY